MTAGNETGKVGPATTATSATPKKVRGLLDVIEAEAKGEAWVLDESDPLAIVGLGLGATPEARRLVLLGLYSERIAALEKKLAELKPKRGAPKKAMSINVKRAAAVLGADDFLRRQRGSGAATQTEAIEVAVQIDAILCDAGERDKPLFGQANQMKSWQDSVSKGLREIGKEGERFLKK